MADRITRNFISITWWPLIILAESILLCQEVDSLPVAQGFLNTLGQMPSGIQYPGVFGLPGGETKSLVTDNFQPNEIVVGSGMTSHPLLTGVAGGIDFAARRVVSAGENIAGAASDLIQLITHGVSEIVSGVLGMGGVNNIVKTFTAPIV